MQKVVEKAMKGDMQAIKFCEEIAWRQEKQSEKKQISPYSIEEVLERGEIEYEKHAEMMTPTWLKERLKRLGLGNGQQKEIDVPAESEPEAAAPTPTESAPVNACDACGKTRCAHGKCPMCDLCEDCK